MVKVSEQLKLQISKIFSAGVAVFVSGLFFFQVSCISDAKQKIIAPKSPTIEITNDIPLEKNSDSTENRLTLEQILDISKLIERFHSATESEKAVAQKLLNESMKEFKNGRYTVAGQGFLESTMIYPSVDSLIMSGESIARLDVKDQPKNEILLYKIKQFEESIIYFELSSKFADKTQQVKELRRHPNLNKNIKCLSDFLNTRKQNCEFIKTILKANNIRN